MEILTYNTKEGTAIIKQGINIHKTHITPEIQELIDKHTKTNSKTEETKKTKQEKTTNQKTTKKTTKKTNSKTEE